MDIKRRAWNIEKKVMSKPFYLWELEGYEGEVNGVSYQDDFTLARHGNWKGARDPKEIILMEYLGKFDETGKEICEGDLIEYDPKEPYLKLGLVLAEMVKIHGCIKAVTKKNIRVNEYDHTPALEGQAVDLSEIKTEEAVRIVGNVYENE